MTRPIAAALFALSVRSLNQSRVRTALTCGLIAMASLAVSCAGGAAASMAAAIAAVASGGARHQAWISVPAATAQCATCRRPGIRAWRDEDIRGLRASLPANLVLGVRNWQHVVARSMKGRPLEPRTVAAVCTDNVNALPTVRWADSRAMVEWRASTRHSGTIAIIGADLGGARLAEKAQRALLRTSEGNVTVVGFLLRVPDVALEARLNGALILPFDSDVGARVCRGGSRDLLLRAASAASLTQGTNAIVEWTRERAALHPSAATPLHIEADDRIDRLLARLTAAAGRWAWVGPAFIAFVCGISALAVNLVFSVERTGEFGIMRAVGARRTDLYALLLLETLIVSLGAVMLPLCASAVSLLLSGASRERWIIEMAALGSGFLVSVALTTLGLFIPGLYAAKAASVSSLEQVGR